MRRVIVESPYAASGQWTAEANVEYARACVLDCINRGEAPFASHLLYTQKGILDDAVHEQRTKGMRAGLAWTNVSDAVVVYVDHGISAGMRAGIAYAEQAGRPVEYRRLGRQTPPLRTLPT